MSNSKSKEIGTISVPGIGKAYQSKMTSL